MSLGFVVNDEQLNRLYHLNLRAQMLNLAESLAEYAGAQINCLLAVGHADQLLLDAALLELQSDCLLIDVAPVDVDDYSVVEQVLLSIASHLLLRLWRVGLHLSGEV